MIDPPDQPDNDEQTSDESEESDVIHYRYRVGKNLTRRIDQYLTDRISYLSRSAVQRLIGDGLVTVNGKPTKASYHPREGDQVVMVAPPEPINELVPENIPLDIIYEDDYFLALNKQANLVVHPARGVWTGTLVNGLVYYGKKWSTLNGDWRPGILHRLDRNTTGVMLVAKSDEAHWRLARQFERRTIQKTYLAICHGIPELPNGVIDMPIGKDRFVREKQAVRKIESGGKEAVTLYHVLETFQAPGEYLLEPSKFANDQHYKPPPAKFSMVKLLPKTGRTHQLRVHMSHMGFPMLGDTMYGGRTYHQGDFHFQRQALHAFEISFVHPVTLENMTLQAPPAADLADLIALLKSPGSKSKSE